MLGVDKAPLYLRTWWRYTNAVIIIIIIIIIIITLLYMINSPNYTKSQPSALPSCSKELNSVEITIIY